MGRKRLLSLLRATSTPHQPATAGFARLLQADADERRWMRGRYLRMIKGLSRKGLVSISYWNCFAFGS